MSFLVKHRPSPAMVVACIALAVALGGTGYSAITLPKNSVGTKQLRKNAVTGLKVKANAITSPKVAANSLTGADINEATLGIVPSATNATTATTAGRAVPSGAAGGGLAGTYPAPTIGANAVGSTNVVDAAGASGLRRVDIAAVSTTAMFNPPNVPAGECRGATVAVPGAQTGDFIVAHPVNTIWGDLVYLPWTAIGGNASIRVCNPTASDVDPGALPFSLLLIR